MNELEKKQFLQTLVRKAKMDDLASGNVNAQIQLSNLYAKKSKTEKTECPEKSREYFIIHLKLLFFAARFKETSPSKASKKAQHSLFGYASKSKGFLEHFLPNELMNKLKRQLASASTHNEFIQESLNSMGVKHKYKDVLTYLNDGKRRPKGMRMGDSKRDKRHQIEKTKKLNVVELEHNNGW